MRNRGGVKTVGVEKREKKGKEVLAGFVQIPATDLCVNCSSLASQMAPA